MARKKPESARPARKKTPAPAAVQAPARTLTLDLSALQDPDVPLRVAGESTLDVASVLDLSALDDASFARLEKAVKFLEGQVALAALAAQPYKK